MSPDFKMVATETGLQVSADLPGRREVDFELIFEGNILCVVGKQSDHAAAFESAVELPLGFNPLEARATYSNGKLRMIVPKVQRRKS